MRKVSGSDVTINQLKKWYFGYAENVDFENIVDRIVVGNTCFATDDNNRIFGFPIDFLDIDTFPMCSEDIIPDNGITVYDFIKNYWYLDECDLEDFDFYLYEEV